MKRTGGRWRPRWVLVINDGRDGAPPSGLRLVGPGRVLLRYPCSARLDGARVTIMHTSQRPCDPGQVLTIATGASARYIGRVDAAAREVPGGTATDPGPREVGESRPEVGVVASEEVNDGRTEARAVDARTSAGEERGG